jgi:tRNA(adenine34) deaminase
LLLEVKRCYNVSVEDEEFMRLALAEAELAYRKGEIPIGAVAAKDGLIIGRGHNQKESLRDPTAHAEMIALRQASQALGGWRLTGVTIYSTLEPCPMCAGALVMARVDRLVYGAADPKSGAVGSLFDIVRSPHLNHRLKVRKGVLDRESQELLDRFFQGLRGE